MRPLLALDLSLTSTGVAWRTANGTIDTRVIRTEPGDNPSRYRKRRDGSYVYVGDENHRMRWIAVGILTYLRHIDRLGADAVRPAVIAESVPTRNARSIVTLAKLHGHVSHALAFDPVYVDPATVKKHITGHGDASKREVAEAVSRRFGCSTCKGSGVIADGEGSAMDCPKCADDRTRTEDEIDALAVLAWAIDKEET